MSSKASTTITCDGCGVSRTFEHGGANSEPWAPWHHVSLEFHGRTRGQPSPYDSARLDACSAACVKAALFKLTVPPLPSTEPKP